MVDGQTWIRDRPNYPTTNDDDFIVIFYDHKFYDTYVVYGLLLICV